MSGLSSGVSFDKRSYITITDIIPGYLSRIHRELLALRTGNPNAEQTTFDIKSNKFVTMSKMSQDIKQSLGNKVKSSVYDYYLKTESNNLLGDNNLNKDQLDKVKGFLSDIASKNMTYTPEDIKNSDVFKSLDPATAKIISNMLDKNITNSSTKDKGQYDLTKSILKIRGATPDLRNEIKEYYDLGYGDILESQGVIQTDKQGNKSINFDKYKEIVKDNSIFGGNSISGEQESSLGGISKRNKGRVFRAKSSTPNTITRSKNKY